jgi:transcriptional regulator with XRE-family HTH domain
MDVCQVVPSPRYIDAVTGRITPWFELVDRRRREIGISQDDLAYRAREFGAPSTLTGSWISAMKNGKRPLAADVLAGIAGALNLDPEVFVEYRLTMARELFNPANVGLDEAAANLESLATAVGEAVPGPPDGELARLLRSATPSEKGRPRSPARRKKARSPRAA